MKFKELLKNIALVCIIAILASCSHSVSLPIPGYSEEAYIWCGPATGQMLMDGYPSGGCYEFQEDIMASLLSHKTELIWETDPEGLKSAMLELCAPASPGTWRIHSETDSTVLMYDAARLMTKYHYGVALVLNTEPHNAIPAHEEHWVVIKGITTDADPTTTSTVNLQFVDIVDPCPEVLGGMPIVRTIAGATWYEEMMKVSKPASSYYDSFVAIMEPPDTRGKALAPKEVKKGALITPEQAKQFAIQWVKQYKLAKKSDYKSLKSAIPGEAMLVNKDYRAYYLVPFINNAKERYASAALIINAYTGAMREAGSFSPVRFLTPEQAKGFALHEMNIDKAKSAEIELVSPENYDFNKYFPLYQVKAENKMLYVDRKGDTYTKDLFPPRIKGKQSGIKVQ